MTNNGHTILFLGLLTAFLPVHTAWAESGEEIAGEEIAPAVTETAPRKTLAERIPSVTRRVFVKQGRVELDPMLGLSLNDPFFDQFITSFNLSYHMLESVSIGLVGDFYAAVSTPVEVAGGSILKDPQYNRPLYGARVEMAWSPLYGKLSLLAEQVLHFDIYALAGVGFVGSTKTGSTLAGVIGLGQHFFINEWSALRVEIRNQMYSLARNPAVDKQRNLQNMFSASVGVCFYLPAEFEREAL